jgi:hypothetical protein
MLRRSNFWPARRGGPDDGYLDLDETQVQEIMNFDCGLCPTQTQDERWKITADEYEEENDGDSFWLSSKNGLKMQAARAVRCGVRMATARAY